MVNKTFCDACGKEIKTKPNKVELHSREGLDGGEWGKYEVCDDCFKYLQQICWSDVKQCLKELGDDPIKWAEDAGILPKRRAY